jgi:hypothetical protein
MTSRLPTSGERHGSCWTWVGGVGVWENSGDGDGAVALWDRGGDRWWSNIRALSGVFFFFFFVYLCAWVCVDG